MARIAVRRERVGRLLASVLRTVTPAKVGVRDCRLLVTEIGVQGPPCAFGTRVTFPLRGHVRAGRANEQRGWPEGRWVGA